MGDEVKHPLYTPEFYAYHSKGSARAADVAMQYLIPLYQPEEVYDVGCGTGEWMDAARRHGGGYVKWIGGIDGPWVPLDQAHVPRTWIRQQDLTRGIARRKPTGMVICVETIEHLPLMDGLRIIGLIAAIARVVVFSAASPTQPGIEHLTLKPMGYWRSYFEDLGFDYKDAIRDVMEKHPDIPVWYRSNICVFEHRVRQPRFEKRLQSR